MTALPHARLSDFDWARIATDVTETGAAVLPKLLTAESCTAVAALYDRHEMFRSRVHMARHNFGKGEYQYFDYPLPQWLAALRSDLYAHLAPVANRWAADLDPDLNGGQRFPTSHRDYIKQCHAVDQQRPTPLLLRYVAGDYNCLHQDLYGAEWFPLQVVVLLNAPEKDFRGGELLVVEQRPRMQSKGTVIQLQQGDAAVIAVNHRPRRSARGYSRVTLRHGVSPLTHGRRHTLGIIFHDAA